MSGECLITNNDLVLYLSVLVVFVLLFPLLDILIVRVAWLYKDELSLLADPITRKVSYFSRNQTVSSISNRSQHVHPMERTAATLVFSNEGSRGSEGLPDSIESPEDAIVYGKSFPRHLSIRGADIEDTSRFIRSADEVTFKSKFAEKGALPATRQARTATKIDALPPIETPFTRDVPGRKRTEKVSVMRDTVEDMYRADDLFSPDRVTLVTPVPDPGIRSAAVAYQSSEYIEKLAATSLLYQETKSAVYVTTSKSNLVEGSSRESTPVLGERKLLTRPGNTRRKAAQLELAQRSGTSPK